MALEAWHSPGTDFSDLVWGVCVSWVFFFFLRLDKHIFKFCFNDKVLRVIEHKFILCCKQAHGQM